MGKLKKTCVSMMTAAMLLSAVFAFTAYADENDDYDYDPKPREIRMVDKVKTVKAGKEFKVRVRMYPRGAEENFLRWTIVKGKNVQFLWRFVINYTRRRICHLMRLRIYQY